MGLGILIPLLVGLMQHELLFGLGLALLCAVLALPLLTRISHLVWVSLPLLWFHHSSPGMLYAWLMFVPLLLLDSFLMPARSVRKLGEHSWILVMCVSSLVLVIGLNGANAAVVGQWIWDFGVLLLYLLITRLPHDAGTLRLFIMWLLLMMGAAAAIVVVEGLMFPGVRSNGIIDIKPTGAAYNLSMFVPLALGAIRGTKLGWIAGVLGAVLFAAIFFTGSRAPFAAVIPVTTPCAAT